MRVLLVDDSPEFVLAVRELLERAGHEVEVATDGSEALLKSRGIKPQVVILDFRMPGFNGAVTGRMLRSFSPGAKIIGVSGLPDLDTSWADAFLSKDDVLDNLNGLIEELTSGAPAEREPQGPS